MSIHQEISPEESTQSALVAYLDELLHRPPPVLPDLKLSPAPIIGVDRPVSKPVPPSEPVFSQLVLPEPALLDAVATARVPDQFAEEDLSCSATLACLYIRSDEQTYALALQQLGRIFPATERRLTVLPGQAPWQLGLLAGEEVLQAISLHHLLHAQPGRAPRYFVSVADSQRVLACEVILNSVQLTPAQLHWRARQRSHPLVAATIRSDLVPLLDLRRLDECLS